MRWQLLSLFLALATPAVAQDQTLIGGTPANPAAWPASVYAKAGGAACSAAVVADQTVLIAAHCVDDQKSITFSVGPNQYAAKCTHSPDYRGDSTADWALCKVTKKVVGVPYESLVTDGGWCAKGKKVRLTGYGCVKEGGGGGNDGVYRIGQSDVTTCPSRNNDTVTKGGAALCFGDSGGPAFVEFADGSRQLFGVNSRGDIKETSYLSSVWTAKAKSFFAGWQATNNQVLCGWPGATGCRGGTNPPPPPPPPPPPKPTLCAAEKVGASASIAALLKCLDP
mgnify:FL=1